MEVVKDCLKQPGVDVNKCISIRVGAVELPALVHAVMVEIKAPSPREVLQLQLVHTLIEHKADPNAAGAEKHRALHHAKTPAIAKALLDARASVDAVMNDGETALMWATYQGLVGVVCCWSTVQIPK